MKELTCPNCNRTFLPETLSDYDFNFLKEAIGKQMQFMFLHCPHCTAMFDFNPMQWISPSALSQSKKNPTSSPKRAKSLALNKEVKCLSQEYINYLKAQKETVYFPVFSEEAPFVLYSLETLYKEITIDKHLCTIITQLKAYATTLEEVGYEEGSFSLERLSQSFSIGYENERILFVDSQDNSSLYIFEIEDGDILKTDYTLTDLIR